MGPIPFLIIYLTVGALIAAWCSARFNEMTPADWIVGIGVIMLWPLFVLFMVGDYIVVTVLNKLRI